uniref:CCZ1/INTU/HSP4 first Longin domain-containing protein n=1 Tax=Arcella intermedia TaxID=1963864 RepID=A0A6B2L4G8_9EUKA
MTKLFIYNPLKFGLTEETEEEKILFFWPETTPLDTKMNDIGLCEALITFSREFSKVPTSSARTERMIYLLLEPEPGWWVVMAMSNPRVVSISTDKEKAGTEEVQYKHDDLDEKALLAALKRVYVQFKIFNGSFENFIVTHKESFREKLSLWFNHSIVRMKPDIEKADIFTCLDGIHFLPVDKNVYLKIQSFINETEKTWDQILYSTFMFKHYLVWSGLEQEEMRAIYRYVEDICKRERESNSKKQDRFVVQSTDPDELLPSNPGIAKPVYLGTDNRLSYLLIYQSQDCSCAFLVSNKANNLNTTFVNNLEKLIKPHLNYLAPIISEHSKKIGTGGEEFKYLYFNHMNLALKTSLDREHITTDISRVLNKMHADFEMYPSLSEILINTQTEKWIAGKKSDQREFFILFEKQANLLEINDEVKKLVAAYFRDIFID